MVGWPATISSVMPWMGMPSGRSGRRGSIIWSMLSLLSRRPLTMRVAPIWMISSPAEGSSPVVSVSKTV
jgi:hypothetical protein